MAESTFQGRHPMKFERRSRLTTGAEYSRVFAKPEVSQDRLFRILYRRNQLPWSRLGMAVSAKICKTAVGRNRIKRVVRESFRTSQDELAGHVGVDLVVLPRKAAATICKSELRASLAKHWLTISRSGLADSE